MRMIESLMNTRRSGVFLLKACATILALVFVGSGAGAQTSPTANPGAGTVLPGADSTIPVDLPVFGSDYFAASRAQIDARRRDPAAAGAANALQSIVGINVFVPSPERYQIGPGDRLALRYWSPVREARDVQLTVDERGSILVPESNERLVLRGQTLQQVEAALRRALRTAINEAEITLTLSELRSISVSILGESYAPGNYEMPAVVTLFNAVYATGGPSASGTLRRIQLKRTNGQVREFDFYSLLLRGDSSQDVPLQPGDVIFFPPASSRVAVRGEVNRPAVYELLAKETVRDAVSYAGGAKPSGVTQRVSIDSIRPGVARRLLDVDLRSSDPSQNPVLYDGDVVEIRSIRPILMNAVQVEGAVDQPGRYAVSESMRVADLVESARGLLDEAYLSRADLFRRNPDGSTRLVPLNLGRALQKTPSDNVLLEPNDRLVVYSVNDIGGPIDRRVEVKGAVRRPGAFARSDNMRVGDLLLQAGGLKADAFADVAFLQRFNADGQPGALVRVDLRQAMANSAEANPELQDRDVLTVLTAGEANFVPTQQTEVRGAVQRPGTYPKAENMTVRDLVQQAGNLLPNANAQRAFLQRQNPNGTAGPLLVINLERALAGDVDQNQVLLNGDVLSVYSLEESRFTPSQTVVIDGAVQRPGTYPRAQGMKLADLLDLAGGLLPGAADDVEIGRARVAAGQRSITVSAREATAGTSPANVELADGDVVNVRQLSEFVEQPQSVRILGAVRVPGSYVIDPSRERVSDLIKRAGGFVEDSFPEGAQFFRDPRFLTTAAQRDLVPQMQEVLRIVSEAEYQRALALSDVEKVQALRGSDIALPSVPGVTGAGVLNRVQAVPGAAAATLLSRETVSRARPLQDQDLAPSGNVNVNVASAVSRPGNGQDLLLRPGDILIIPPKPTTVAVLGAVVVPSSVVYEPGRNAMHYINQAGGPTLDGSDRIYIIRARGGVVNQVRPNARVELGDVIFVPTKVQSARLRDRQGEIDSAISRFGNIAVTLAVIRALTTDRD